MFLLILNQVMRIVAQDSEAFRDIKSFTTDGASVYDLSDELTYEPFKIKLIQLAGTTLDGVQGPLLDDIDI